VHAQLRLRELARDQHAVPAGAVIVELTVVGARGEPLNGVAVAIQPSGKQSRLPTPEHSATSIVASSSSGRVYDESAVRTLHFARGCRVGE
jgi:hypothetical protein